MPRSNGLSTDGLSSDKLLERLREIREDMSVEDVTENGLELRYITRQTPRIVLAAIRQNINAKRYINIPLTEEIEHEIILQSI